METVTVAAFAAASQGPHAANRHPARVPGL